MSFTFSENFVLLEQLWIGATFFANFRLKVNFQLKSDHLGPTWHQYFDHLGGLKTNFLGFLKLFLSWSGVVWALLLGIKTVLLDVFSVRKVDIWPLKKCRVKFWPSERPFWQFSGLKTHFLDILRVFELFRSCLSIFPVKNQYNRMNIIFSDNFVFLKQFWIGATFFDQVLAES